MRFWTNAQWYPVLTRSKDVLFVGDWNLYQDSETSVELIHCSGYRCTASVNADGVAQVKGEPQAIDLLDAEVTDVLKSMLGLE